MKLGGSSTATLPAISALGVGGGGGGLGIYTNNVGTNNNNNNSSIALTLYTLPPNREIRLDEFERLAVERLKVMNLLDEYKAATLDRDVGSKIGKLVADSFLKINNEEEKYDDLLSHWILRMAFCVTEESRKRFLNFEEALFRYRFEEISKLRGGIDSFLKNEDLYYEKLSEEEKRTLLVDLRSVYDINAYFRKNTVPPFDFVEYYKVKFTEVLDLVSSRTTVIRNGFAYIREDEMISSLVNRFLSNLSAQLEVASKTVEITKRDDRIGPLLQKLTLFHASSHTQFNLKDRMHGEVNPSDIPMLAAKNFPLCAKRLERTMRTEHHLKYQSRLQYMLFLKGLGLSMENCLKYFESEFAKKGTTSEEFRKKGYGYSIRHSYGQEGKRADYTPYNCMKTIMLPNPGSGEAHGCPFKVMDQAGLTRLIGENANIGEDKIKILVQSAREGNFQIACRLHWEIMHPGGSSDRVGNHPNKFVEESIKYFVDKETEKKNTEEAASLLQSNALSSSSSSQQAA